jgi:hypothetical protein
LPVGYFHVVFTLPGKVADIAWQNKEVVYDLLFKTSSETMMTIAADPKHLGARIGITAVLLAICFLTSYVSASIFLNIFIMISYRLKPHVAC